MSIRNTAITPVHKGKHYLKGKIRFDEDVLKSWTDKWLLELSTHQKGRRGVLAHRLSLYLVPIGIGEGDLTKKERQWRQDLKSALEDRFLQSGYRIKGDVQKGEAHYRLLITKAQFEKDKLRGVFVFTVEAYQNRADGAIVGTVADRTAASMKFTTSVMYSNLLERAALKVSAVLQAIFNCVVLPQATMEVVFSIPPQQMPEPDAYILEKRLLKGLADIYGIKSGREMRDFDDVVKADVTERHDLYTFSYVIPGDYPVRIRELEARLRALYAAVFKSQAPQLRSSEAGKKLIVSHEVLSEDTLDPTIPESSWAVRAEQMIREGKLDAPLGVNSNALDTLRHHLRRRPKEPEALEFLKRIALIFWEQAKEAASRKQTGSAKRYLDRAEKVLRRCLKASCLAIRRTIR